MEYNGVILSGTPGAGKSALAQRLIETYNWEKLSLGDYWKDTYRKAYPQCDVDFATFWRSTSREENLRINREARTILERGGIVCDSCYTAAYCQDLPLLLVYVDARVETRAWRLTGKPLYARMNVTRIAATLTECENDEVTRGKEFFGEAYDYREKELYELVLDSGKLTIEQELQIIRTYMLFEQTRARQ